MTKPKDKPVKSYGISKKIGIRADIDVPIVKTGKPKVTVVTPLPRKDKK